MTRSPPSSSVPPPVAQPVPRLSWRGEGAGRRGPTGERMVAEETPIAFSYDGAAHAVMMATPADLDDFAVGFSLTEGIIGAAADIQDLETVVVPQGINIRLWLREDRRDAMDRRRRRMAGPVGCGLCGLESLDEAARVLPVVGKSAVETPDGAIRVTPAMVAAARDSLGDDQPLFRETRAVHAAGFWTPGSGMLLVREDVGRHNALDKLAGALARAAVSPTSGIVVMSSRVSVELVQKAAMMGAPLLLAVSAPTALAIRTAETAGITLIGIARRDGFEVFTHPDRIIEDEKDVRDVA